MSAAGTANPAEPSPTKRTANPASPIDSYLDELDHKLPAHARQWRLLVEARDHLLDKTAEYESIGLSRRQAEQRAVKDFGSAGRIVGSSVSSLVRSGELLKELVRGLWLVVAVLCVAVGLSGLLANVFGSIWGQSFVSGDMPGVTYTAWRCTEYQQLVPAAADCTSAAITHHFGEIVDTRVGLGIVGLIGLGLWYAFVRRLTRSQLPSLVWLAVLLAPSGLLAAAGLFMGGMPLILSRVPGGAVSGAGDMLSVGIVFTVVSAVGAWLFWKQSQKFVATTK